MKGFIKFAANYPRAVLLVLAVLSLLSATQIGQLRIMVSAEGMMEKGTPAWDYYVATEETFGSEDVAVVVLRDSNVFHPDKIALIREVARALGALPFISRTTSLFDVPNLKNIDDTIHTRPYLDPPPATPEEIEQLKADAIRNPLVLGNLISADGQTMAINVYFAESPGDARFDRKVTAAIEQTIAPLRAHINEVYQVGAAAIRSDLTAKLRADQREFLPLSVLVLLLTLAFSLRRANAALIPLSTAAISVVWTLGFMGWMDIPLNIMTSIVPALVIIIGSTEDIHLLAEYSAGISDQLTRRAAIARMADNMGMAVLLTFITTYLGFFSIALNDVEMLYQFGLVASTGLLFNFVITLLLVPVMLRYFGHQQGGAVKVPPGHSRFQRWAVSLVTSAQRRRIAVFVVAAALVALALVSATQLRINNDLLDYLDDKSELRADIERIHTELSGVNSFSIVLDTGIDDTFLHVKYLQEVLKIQAFVDSMHEFDRSFSFANFMAMVNSVMEDVQDAAPRLPQTDDMVREYMLFIKHDHVASFVSSDYDRARILVRHNITSSDTLNRAIAELKAYIDADIDPALRVVVTGKSVLSILAVEQMAHGQLQSLLLVGAVIVALLSILYVSLRAGFIALLPNLLPVTALFGVMALAGIPLNAGTSMVAAIALGICVDDTMHMMSRFHEELKRHETRAAALEAVIHAEAVPIFATSIALAAGFGVFVISSFGPVVNFGLLSGMVILVALLATFILTPLLLASRELLTVWDLLSYKVQKEALQRSQLFQGMRIWQIKKILLASEIRRFAEDERIICEGDIGNEMFVVLEGRVAVQRHPEDGRVRHLRVMQVGELFGEVGPLSGGQRTADVMALVDTQVLVLSWERIDRLTRRFPLLAFRLFRNLTRITGARLLLTSEYKVEAHGSPSDAATG